MQDMDAAALRGFQRFGLGVRLGEQSGEGDGDVRAALLAEAERRIPPLVKAPGLDTSAETARKFFAFEKLRMASRKATLTADDDMARKPAPASQLGGKRDMSAPEDALRGKDTPYPQQVYRDELIARFEAAQREATGFGERLAQFWSNHFCVSGVKGRFILALAGPYEREAIRPHVFGRFEDMLLAVETHPAMLFYLDNQRSIGPSSRGGQRRGRGLNENLAREILELHTLGAQGGYTQNDVVALAKILTGWTYARGDRHGAEEGGFFFNENLHEPSAQTLLGNVYYDQGVEQGRRALRDLARHPSTARHIALKLTRWFVADDPPQTLVDLLAQTYRKTNGDLGSVSAALIASDVAWKAPAVKIRTPQEFVIASSRAMGRTFGFGQVGVALRAMAQPLWQPRGPNGFPADVASLTAPAVIAARLDVAAQLARHAGGGIDPRQWAARVIGAQLSAETKQAVAQAETRHQAIALTLMSPEFLRR